MKTGEFIKRLLDKLKADKQGIVEANDLLTNKRLLEELSHHFKTVLEEESVGRRMLYPMSFNILMDPVDYEARKLSLPFILPEVVSAFYGIIDDMRIQYPNYTPPAKYWYFQFSSCQMNSIQTANSAPLIVRRGHITTVATLMSFDIKNANNVFVDSNTRVSIKLDDSNVMNDVNVNWNAIRNLDVLSDGVFTYEFDESLNRDSQHIIDNSNMMETNGLAELSYSKVGHNYHFVMKDNLIHISGKNEMRRGRSFFILEDEHIKDSHVQIRYIANKKKFQLAAFGPTRLNSRKLDESKGGEVLWYDLANHSTIFINDEISVRFEIK